MPGFNVIPFIHGMDLEGDVVELEHRLVGVEQTRT
jgi:hypothetical protein